VASSSKPQQEAQVVTAEYPRNDNAGAMQRSSMSTFAAFSNPSGPASTEHIQRPPTVSGHQETFKEQVYGPSLAPKPNPDPPDPRDTRSLYPAANTFKDFALPKDDSPYISQNDLNLVRSESTTAPILAQLSAVHPALHISPMDTPSRILDPQNRQATATEYGKYHSNAPVQDNAITSKVREVQVQNNMTLPLTAQTSISGSFNHLNSDKNNTPSIMDRQTMSPDIGASKGGGTSVDILEPEAASVPRVAASSKTDENVIQDQYPSSRHLDHTSSISPEFDRYMSNLQFDNRSQNPLARSFSHNVARLGPQTPILPSRHDFPPTPISTAPPLASHSYTPQAAEYKLRMDSVENNLRLPTQTAAKQTDMIADTARNMSPAGMPAEPIDSTSGSLIPKNEIDIPESSPRKYAIEATHRDVNSKAGSRLHAGNVPSENQPKPSPSIGRSEDTRKIGLTLRTSSDSRTIDGKPKPIDTSSAQASFVSRHQADNMQVKENEGNVHTSRTYASNVRNISALASNLSHGAPSVGTSVGIDTPSLGFFTAGFTSTLNAKGEERRPIPKSVSFSRQHSIDQAKATADVVKQDDARLDTVGTKFSGQDALERHLKDENPHPSRTHVNLLDVGQTEVETARPLPLSSTLHYKITHPVLAEILSSPPPPKKSHDLHNDGAKAELVEQSGTPSHPNTILVDPVRREGQHDKRADIPQSTSQIHGTNSNLQSYEYHVGQSRSKLEPLSQETKAIPLPERRKPAIYVSENYGRSTPKLSSTANTSQNVNSNVSTRPAEQGAIRSGVQDISPPQDQPIHASRNLSQYTSMDQRKTTPKIMETPPSEPENILVQKYSLLNVQGVDGFHLSRGDKSFPVREETTPPLHVSYVEQTPIISAERSAKYTARNTLPDPESRNYSPNQMGDARSMSRGNMTETITLTNSIFPGRHSDAQQQADQSRTTPNNDVEPSMSQSRSYRVHSSNAPLNRPNQGRTASKDPLQAHDNSIHPSHAFRDQISSGYRDRNTTDNIPRYPAAVAELPKATSVQTIDTQPSDVLQQIPVIHNTPKERNPFPIQDDHSPPLKSSSIQPAYPSHGKSSSYSSIPVLPPSRVPTPSGPQPAINSTDTAARPGGGRTRVDSNPTAFASERKIEPPSVSPSPLPQHRADSRGQLNNPYPKPVRRMSSVPAPVPTPTPTPTPASTTYVASTNASAHASYYPHRQQTSTTFPSSSGNVQSKEDYSRSRSPLQTQSQFTLFEMTPTPSPSALEASAAVIPRAPSEDTILITPTSFAHSTMLKPTTSRQSAASVSSQTGVKKSSGVLNMFRKAPAQSQEQPYAIWHPDPSTKTPHSSPGNATKEVKAVPSIAPNKYTAADIPIPVRVHDTREYVVPTSSNVFSRLLKTKRNRAISVASVEAQDGTAVSTHRLLPHVYLS